MQKDALKFTTNTDGVLFVTILLPNLRLWLSVNNLDMRGTWIWNKFIQYGSYACRILNLECRNEIMAILFLIFCRKYFFLLTQYILYRTGAVQKQDAPYGPGKGSFVLDTFNCVGAESSIVRCDHKGPLNNSCSHNEDVGVICCKCFVLSNLFLKIFV